VYMQTAVKYNTFYIHHPGVEYIQTVLFYSSLHIHHQMVHTSHFPIFLGPNPVVVYIFGVRSMYVRRHCSVLQFNFEKTGTRAAL